MRHRIGIWSLLAVLIAPCAAVRADQAFPLKDGDVWVMAGDSITYQRIHTSYIEAFCRTRFPKLKLRFRNSGVGGDWAHRVLARFDWDVAEWQPTIVSIELGMNDVKGREKGCSRYINDITKLIGKIRALKARALLLGASPRSDGYWGRNKLIQLYTAELKKLAEKENLPFVDQINALLPRWSKNYVPSQLNRYLKPMLQKKSLPNHEELQAWYDKWQKSDQWPMNLGNVVHPNHRGQIMMTYVILKGLRAPTLVSRATIAVNAKKPADLAGCTISKLVCGPDKVSFVRADECLPMPIADRGREAFRMFPEIPEISEYLFTIKGLKPGDYVVKIDGIAAATVSAEALAKGWNATRVAKGPIADQNRKVLRKIQEKVNHVDTYRRALKTHLNKHDAHSSRGRRMDPSKAKVLVASSLKAINALDAEIDKLVQPVPHTFEFTRASSERK